MRALVTKAKFGELTQGAIFNCLRTPDAGKSYGVVVSARCDIAHRKSKTVLCLPILPLKDWMSTVGKQEVISQAGKSVEKTASDILEKYKIAKESFQIYGYDSTIEILKIKNIRKNDLDCLESLKPYIEEKDIIKSNKQMKEVHNRILDSLWRNSRLDSHFIERIKTDEECVGYIIDFTQPITLNRIILDELSLGLDKLKYDREKTGKYSNINLDGLDDGEIFSTLQSPFIEHILQRFTNYYSRIGTSDISKIDFQNLKGTYEIA